MLPPELASAIASLAHRDQYRRVGVAGKKATVVVNEASASQKGTVELADDGEDAPQVAVQGNDYRLPMIVKKTSDQGTTAGGLHDDSTLRFPLHAARFYSFRFVCLVRSTESEIGVRLSVTIPSPERYGATARVIHAAAGSAAEFQGALTTSGEVLTTTVLADNDTDYVATIEGLVIPSEDGFLQLRFGDEAGFSAITMRKGSVGFLYDLGV